MHCHLNHASDDTPKSSQQAVSLLSAFLALDLKNNGKETVMRWRICDISAVLFMEAYINRQARTNKTRLWLVALGGKGGGGVLGFSVHHHQTSPNCQAKSSQITTAR